MLKQYFPTQFKMVVIRLLNEIKLSEDSHPVMYFIFVGHLEMVPNVRASLRCTSNYCLSLKYPDTTVLYIDCTSVVTNATGNIKINFAFHSLNKNSR